MCLLWTEVSEGDLPRLIPAIAETRGRRGGRIAVSTPISVEERDGTAKLAANRKALQQPRNEDQDSTGGRERSLICTR